MESKYKRVIIKLSGEALAGERGFGIDQNILRKVACEIKEVHDLGVEIAIVVGGGNFWRGRSNDDMDMATADYIGMLATIMNSLALQEAIETVGLSTRVQTAIAMREIAEPYVRRKAISHLEKKRIVIFGGGTGSPFFSTDTTAALRAAEIDAEVILLAKNIDGVYSADPKIDKNATLYKSLSHMDVLEKGLKVMDSTASSLCKDNNITIHVFELAKDGNLIRAIHGEDIGTIIK